MQIVFYVAKLVIVSFGESLFVELSTVAIAKMVLKFFFFFLLNFFS